MRNIEMNTSRMTMFNDWENIDPDVRCVMCEVIITWLNGKPQSESTEVLATRKFYVTHEMRPAATGGNLLSANKGDLPVFLDGAR